jgi:hypothetical protein
MSIFNKLLANKINTWDYQWAITNFLNNGLSIIPNMNLISNIGFGANATHTINSRDKYSKINIDQLKEISHPIIKLAEKEADFFTLNNEYRIRRIAEKKILRKLKFWKKYSN